VLAVQVILKAIAQSDGTRKGVRDQVFVNGVTVPASESVLGKDITIDKATGDSLAQDMVIKLVTGKAETFLKTWETK
jgi:branched-chain amino acid transport system substrate-binding protein